MCQIEESHHSVSITHDQFYDQLTDLQNKLDAKTIEFEKLSSKINSLEQYTRKAHIRIFGIVESDGEDCIAIAKKLFREKLGITSEISIDAAHRVGVPKRRGSGTNTEIPRPSGIIVRFIRRDERFRVLLNRKNLKSTGVVIVEDMTVENVKLLDSARNSRRVKSAWFTNGKVFVVGQNDCKFRLERIGDLNSKLPPFP
ncbi:hypothetical protein LOTGIDRAFT_153944 [Lottia gigantea]|uniref:Uncharacterized protein n=1 Tax=Lottia gigantea TaxID=225164 RepID=V4A487_LOTGI|nr:hypothetical protein LOTGIDRAFT_153944 [Lottia gigantea]ESO91502.1 hypothetical protein LOTGIDRAFT_153944 [Lottia gigantea]